MAVLSKMWRDYKVKESPVTTQILAQGSAIKKVVYAEETWTEWLSPDPSKCVWWLERLREAFEFIFAKAQAESKKRLTLGSRSYAYRDSNVVEVFQVSMAWAAWQEEMKTMVPEKKMAELNKMFCRGLTPQLSAIVQQVQSRVGATACGLYVPENGTKRPALQDLRHTHLRGGEGQEVGVQGQDLRRNSPRCSCKFSWYEVAGCRASQSHAKMFRSRRFLGSSSPTRSRWTRSRLS